MMHSTKSIPVNFASLFFSVPISNGLDFKQERIISGLNTQGVLKLQEVQR